MISISAGLRRYLTLDGSLKAALDNSLLFIFSGPVPSDATAAADPSCVKLCEISLNGDSTPLVFDSALSAMGGLMKPPGDLWTGNVLENGTATFYRLVSGGGSPVEEAYVASRVQGTVGESGADMIVASANLEAGKTQPVEFFYLQLPLQAG